MKKWILLILFICSSTGMAQKAISLDSLRVKYKLVIGTGNVDRFSFFGNLNGSNELTASGIPDDEITGIKLSTTAFKSTHFDRVLNGSAYEFKLKDNALTWALLSQAVRDSIQAGGSGNITHNNTPDGVTIVTNSDSLLEVPNDGLNARKLASGTFETNQFQRTLDGTWFWEIKPGGIAWNLLAQAAKDSAQKTLWGNFNQAAKDSAQKTLDNSITLSMLQSNSVTGDKVQNGTISALDVATTGFFNTSQFELVSPLGMFQWQIKDGVINAANVADNEIVKGLKHENTTLKDTVVFRAGDGITLNVSGDTITVQQEKIRYYATGHIGGEESLFVIKSSDGIAWDTVSFRAYPDDPFENIRDPSLMFHNASNYWYSVHTLGFSTPRGFGINKSRDLIVWEEVDTVWVNSIFPRCGDVWGPEFFIDPMDGNVYVSVSIEPDAGTDNILIGMKALNDELTLWSEPRKLIGDFPIDVTDQYIFYDWTESGPNKYKMIYKDISTYASEDSNYLDMAEAPSFFGKWTTTKQDDWAGWGARWEGPSVYYHGDGKYTVYIDSVAEQGLYYTTTTDTFKTFTKPSQLTYKNNYGVNLQHISVVGVNPEFSTNQFSASQSRTINFETRSEYISGAQYTIPGGVLGVDTVVTVNAGRHLKKAMSVRNEPYDVFQDTVGAVSHFRFENNYTDTKNDSAKQVGSLNTYHKSRGSDGAAIKLDGSGGNYVKIEHNDADSLQFGVNDDFTFGMYFKLIDWSRDHILFSKGSGGEYYRARINSTAKTIDWLLGNSTGGDVTIATGIIDTTRGVLAHFVVDAAADSAFIYVDGIEAAGEDISSVGDFSDLNTFDFRIGYFDNTSSTFPNILVDEFICWRERRTHAQITTDAWNVAQRHQNAASGVAYKDTVAANTSNVPSYVTESLIAYYNGENATTSNDSVSSWLDVGGAGNNGTGSGASRPVVVANTLNGKSVLDFDGGDNLTASGIDLTQACEIWIVLKQDVNGANEFSFDGDDATNRLAFWQTPKIFAGSTLTSSSINTASWHIYRAVFNTTSSALYVDGNASANVSGDAGSNTLDGMKIGSDWNNGTNLNGQIAAIMVYNKTLTTAEAQKNWNHLNGVYSVY